jgi:wyosine [tRNA(Phe)-imidazoG37] synthetase (radical SAM superfamily)
MSTILFDSIIFGPVKSRRLGISLGINLLPNDSKLCNFNCLYCECGFTRLSHPDNTRFHPAEEVLASLKSRLQEMRIQGEPVETITFAGNGEPTMHPAFGDIVEGVISLRNQLFPGAAIAVLSNATLCHRPKVYAALQKIDLNILKLDTAIEETFQLLNQPPPDFTLDKLIHNLSLFKENLIIQSMFVRGIYNGKPIDNTLPHELDAWLRVIRLLAPANLMIYSIARETPLDTLFKVPDLELEKIARLTEEAGIQTAVYD